MIDQSDAQAKAIDASITAAFYNGMERAAKIVEKQAGNQQWGRDLAAAIRSEIKT